MELDLNQEPLDHQTSTLVVEFDSVLEELEYTEENIRNRISRLEEITSRARQQQGLPQRNSLIRITNFTGEAIADDVQGEEGREERRGGLEGVVESGKDGKRKSAYLVAKALGMDEIDEGKVEESSGSFYDCNICLDVARDPVLTCCGHLFCWPCFYQLSYVYSKAKECPVCKGEVTESGIIPIYGNGNANGDCQMELKEAGLRVPPRPKAPRIESIRQKLLSQGASSSSIVQSIRRFHNRIGGFGEQVQLESPNTIVDRINGGLTRSRSQRDNIQNVGSPQISRLLEQGASSFSSSLNSALESAESPNTVADRIRSVPARSGTQRDNIQDAGSHQVSRLLGEGASSFSSLSSALNSAMDSAERLVQDLESYIHGHQIGGSRELNPSAVNNNRSESRAQDVVAVTNSSAAEASESPLTRNVDNISVTGSESQTTDRDIQVIPIDPSSSNGRRRNDSSRHISIERRRRRLR